MKQIMLEETPVEQREQILRDSCDDVVQMSYTRKFSPAEISDRKSELVNVLIQIDELEQQFAEIKADLKGRIKPLQERGAKLRNELKAGGEYMVGDCFKFVNEETGEIAFYSPEGCWLEAESKEANRYNTAALGQ